MEKEEKKDKKKKEEEELSFTYINFSFLFPRSKRLVLWVHQFFGLLLKPLFSSFQSLEMFTSGAVGRSSLGAYASLKHAPRATFRPLWTQLWPRLLKITVSNSMWTWPPSCATRLRKLNRARCLSVDNCGCEYTWIYSCLILHLKTFSMIFRFLAYWKHDSRKASALLREPSRPTPVWEVLILYYFHRFGFTGSVKLRDLNENEIRPLGVAQRCLAKQPHVEFMLVRYWTF